MQSNPMLVLFLSGLMGVACMALKYFIYDVNSNYLPDMSRIVLVTIDTLKDIVFIGYILYYMLYGVTLF